MKSLHPKEVEAITRLDSLNRYQYFMKRVADFEVMYSLQDEEGDWVMADIDEHGLFCVWPFPEFASACAVDDWEGCKVVAISLDTYQKEIVELIKEENMLLNIFSSSDKTGFIVSQVEFARDLNKELAQYS